MAHEAALAIVNTVHSQSMMLMRSAITALADKKVSAMEGMQLGMQGFTFASYVITVLQGMDTVMKDDILYVLEHASLMMDK